MHATFLSGTGSEQTTDADDVVRAGEAPFGPTLVGRGEEGAFSIAESAWPGAAEGALLGNGARGRVARNCSRGSRAAWPARGPPGRAVPEAGARHAC
eukprot:76007-Rhodomonas_salina.2